MPEENVLVRFTTLANLAGADALKASLFGLNVESLALVAVLAVLYKVGSDGIENFKKQETATNLLTQAYATQKDTLAEHGAAIEAFLNTNARFISDQYDTQEALASIIRAGYDTAAALNILGDALDYAAIKHIPVTDAEKTLVLAMAGNKKAVKDLLGDTVAFDKIMNDKTLPTAEKHRRILALIEARIKGGRDAIDETTQKQNELNKSWQGFTEKTAPGLLKVWGKLIEAASTLVGILDLTVQLIDKIAGSHNAAYDLTHEPSPTGGRAVSKGVGGFGGVGTRQTAAVVNLTINGGMFMDHGPTIDAISNALIRHARFRPGT